MRKVFYTSGGRVSFRPPGSVVNDGSDSELETDIEEAQNAATTDQRKPAREKPVHRRSESMVSDGYATTPHDVNSPTPNAVANHGSSATANNGSSSHNGQHTASNSIAPVNGELTNANKKQRKLGNPIVRQRQISRDIRDATGQRPLQKACSRGDSERVRLLLAENPDLEDRDYAGTTASHTASVQGHADIVKDLIKAGAVVDVRSGPEELDTPLVDAVANGNRSVVYLLLKAGADPRVTNAVGRTALDFVDDSADDADEIRDALRTKTKELRCKGVPPIESPDDKRAPPGSFPPGFVTVQRPAAPAFLDVTKRGARAEIVEHAAMGHLEYVGSALERGWRPNAEALVKAARYGHTEVVGLSLAFGLQADQEYDGTTASHEAIKRSHLGTAKLLVDSGAKLTRGLERYVSDSPDWDKSRAFVMQTEAKSIPASQMASPEPESKQKLVESELDVRSESRQNAEGMHSTPTLRAKPLTVKRPPQDDVKKEEPVVKSTPSVNSTPSVKSRSGSITEASTVDAKLKVATSKDSQLSKVDSRSIRPKKRSKSVVAASNPENASIAPVPEKRTTVPLVNTGNDALKELHESSLSPISGSTETPSIAAPDTSAPIPNGANSASPVETEAHHEGDTHNSSPTLSTKERSGSVSRASSRSHSRSASVSASRATSPTSTHRKASTPVSSSEPPPAAENKAAAAKVSESLKWAERSQELSELAQLKEKQRKDREAKMLEALTQCSHRRSVPGSIPGLPSTANADVAKTTQGSTDTTVKSAGSAASSPGSQNSSGPTDTEIAAKVPTLTVQRASPGLSPYSSPSLSPSLSENAAELSDSVPKSARESPGVTTASSPSSESSKDTQEPPTEPVSVSHLPWALRRLAYTGKPQAVSPSLIHEMAGDQFFVDIQVASATGDAKLHEKHPDLTKAVITPQQKQSLWPFCRPWSNRPGESGPIVTKCRQTFMDMHLCWLPVSETVEKLFSSKKPPTVRIQLDTPSSASSRQGSRKSSSVSAGSATPNNSTSIDSATQAENTPVSSFPLRWQHKLMTSW